jgi:ACT domain-containing protein
VPDQAGELKRVLSVLEQQKVNIQDIIHERSITSVPVGKVLISVTVNLQNKEQLDIIKQDLNHKGITCRNIM